MEGATSVGDNARPPDKERILPHVAPSNSLHDCNHESSQQPSSDLDITVGLGTSTPTKRMPDFSSGDEEHPSKKSSKDKVNVSPSKGKDNPSFHSSFCS